MQTEYVCYSAKFSWEYLKRYTSSAPTGCSLPYDSTETGGKSSHHLCCDVSARIDNAVKKS